jgi:hypothetical protein
LPQFLGELFPCQFSLRRHNIKATFSQENRAQLGASQIKGLCVEYA